MPTKRWTCDFWTTCKAIWWHRSLWQRKFADTDPDVESPQFFDVVRFSSSWFEGLCRHAMPFAPHNHRLAGIAMGRVSCSVVSAVAGFNLMWTGDRRTDKKWKCRKLHMARCAREHVDWSAAEHLPVWNHTRHTCAQQSCWWCFTLAFTKTWTTHFWWQVDRWWWNVANWQAKILFTPIAHQPCWILHWPFKDHCENECHVATGWLIEHHIVRLNPQTDLS